MQKKIGAIGLSMTSNKTESGQFLKELIKTSRKGIDSDKNIEQKLEAAQEYLSLVGFTEQLAQDFVDGKITEPFTKESMKAHLEQHKENSSKISESPEYKNINQILKTGQLEV